MSCFPALLLTLPTVPSAFFQSICVPAKSAAVTPGGKRTSQSCFNGFSSSSAKFRGSNGDKFFSLVIFSGYAGENWNPDGAANEEFGLNPCATGGGAAAFADAGRGAEARVGVAGRDGPSGFATLPPVFKAADEGRSPSLTGFLAVGAAIGVADLLPSEGPAGFASLLELAGAEAGAFKAGLTPAGAAAGVAAFESSSCLSFLGFSALLEVATGLAGAGVEVLPPAGFGVDVLSFAAAAGFLVKDAASFDVAVDFGVDMRANGPGLEGDLASEDDYTD